MNPGDEWSAAEGLKPRRRAPDWSRRMEHIEEMSRAARGRVAEYFASEPAAPPDLYDRFHEHFCDLIVRDPTAAKRIGITTWWQVTGPQGGDWSIDFGRDREPVRRGVPDAWNLRLTVPDKLVHLGVSRQAIWENLVLSFRVRLARQPDRYMSDFWTWFCKL
jgi:hypothetical protein